MASGFSSMASEDTERGGFERGTDWELEAEVEAEVGWGGEAGRKI